MLFNSLEFLAFGVLFFALWPIFNKSGKTARCSYLTIASFIFYGWWDWRFLFLIIGSGLVDFIAGSRIHKAVNTAKKKAWLYASLVGNLGSLAVFKYSSFIAEVIEDTAALVGLSIQAQAALPPFTLILPVGISFYTFQSMSYTLDIYKGKLKPTTNLAHFFAYLSMFPQLVAGPIVRAKDILGQLAVRRKTNYLQKWNGIKLIVFGLFQKMVIADNLSLFVDSAYQDKIVGMGTATWWLALVAFAFQIYCDFSGYSLVARGLAKFMGYHFKMNFNHPYHASSLRAFWQRWHISLSTWFRDYVYIPLGGSKKGFYPGLFFMFLTMLISGIWHGANYTFIIWGALHGLLLGIERIVNRKKLIRLPSFVNWLLVMFSVLICWNFFRAENAAQAFEILGILFASEPSEPFIYDQFYNSLFILTIGALVELVVFLRHNFPPLFHFYFRWKLDWVLVGLSLVGIVFFRGVGQAFIYFQF